MNRPNRRCGEGDAVTKGETREGLSRVRPCTYSARSRTDPYTSPPGTYRGSGQHTNEKEKPMTDIVLGEAAHRMDRIDPRERCGERTREV